MCLLERGGADVDDGAEPHAGHALPVRDAEPAAASGYAARVPEPVEGM